MHWFRLKCGREEDLALIIGRDDFLTCPLHALSTHAALLKSPSPNIFSSYAVATGDVALNKHFRRIEDLYMDDLSENKPVRYSKGLSSHSIRSGANNVLDNFPGLNRSWIELRVGRTLKRDVKDSEAAYINR
jgi:hypothetical protein